MASALSLDFQDGKVLSLCIPTYNRANELRTQLLRMLTLSDDILEQMEIIISDNCSTDATEQTVEQFADRIPLRYIRNQENIGPDGNFRQCLQEATGRYVWLLGDDDPLQTTHLPDLLALLKTDEWGLIHVCRFNKRETFHAYDDPQQLLCEIGMMVTFMSANIFRRDRALLIDLEPYMGTNLVQVPMYLSAALSAKRNALFHRRVFDPGTAMATNGGYNLLRVFVKNLSDLLDDFEEGVTLRDGQHADLSPHTVMTVKNKASDFMFPFILNYLVLKKRSNFDTQGGWNLIKKHWGIQRVAISALKFTTNPQQIANITKHLYQKVKHSTVPLLMHASLIVWPRWAARKARDVKNAFVSWRFALATAQRRPCFIQGPLYHSGAKYMYIGEHFSALPGLRIECIPTGPSEPRLTIGNNVSLNAYVHIACSNSVTIGNNVLSGSHVLITDHNHGRTDLESLKTAPHKRPLYSKGPVVIEDDVWIGENVCILPGVTIGRGAVIGAGSVVTNDIPPYSVFYGKATATHASV